MPEINPELADATAALKEKRIKNVHESRSLWNEQRRNSLLRRQNFGKVLNQLNGGKPLDDKELVVSGQGWRCNINFRDGASAFEQVLISYWRLLHDATNVAAVTVHDDSPQAERGEALFQDAFNRFLDDWGDEYVRNYQLLSSNHIGFGVGVVFWPDPKSPKWEIVRLGDIEVPPRAKAEMKSLSAVSILQELTVEDLWDKFRTPGKAKSAAAAGWDVDAVKVLLHRHTKGTTTSFPQGNDYVMWEDEIRNNSMFLSQKHGPVKVVYQFIKEYDGKISTYIFAPDVAHGDNYLFDNSETTDRPTEMRELMGCVFFEAGNGLFWGSKGFGQKNYQIAMIQNRLKSRAVDRSIIMDGLNFIDDTDGGLGQVPITQVGPINILPKGLTQLTTYPTGSAILETIEMLDQQSSYNNARYRDESQQIAKTQTKGQAEILANLQSQVDVANATLYLKQIGKNILCEQFRRLRKKGNTDPDAVEFKTRCVEEGGMDEDFFHDAKITVRTGSDPGAASPAVQAAHAKELIQMSNNPNVNDRWAWEKYVTFTFGPNAVKKALRPLDDLGDTAAVKMARLENDAMGHGTPIPVDVKDNHAIHLPEHIQPLAVIADNYRTTGRVNPDSIVALMQAIPHCDQHFEFLKMDKTQDETRKKLWPQYTEIRNVAMGIMRQVQKMHQDATQGGPGGPPGQQPGAQPGAPGGVDLNAASGALAPQ